MLMPCERTGGIVADDTRGPGNGLLYGLLGALCVVVVGGGYYIYQNNPGNSLPLPAQATAPVAPVAPVAKPAPAPASAPAQPAGPSAAQLNQARGAIADARRLAARGDFSGAETALQAADRIIPGFAETSAARSEIADMRSGRGDPRRDRAERRDPNRIATLVDTARAAIARRDYAAADRALDEAERIDARDPSVKRARNELLEAAARPGR
jgi:hypothetical protein